MADLPDTTPGTDGKRLSRPEIAAWIGLLFALVVCAIVALMVLAPFFSVTLLAVVASGLIRPSYRKLTAAVKGRRHAAAVLICIILLSLQLFFIVMSRNDYYYDGNDTVMEKKLLLLGLLLSHDMHGYQLNEMPQQ